ncbi:polysaccharide deacetylase family protein [Aceticella autotrophica]|uniref:Polysaccharide deacetylase family protein n=1 Tax=Aceticella autotrophica TaxID=2755338 RepID=A0A975AWP4_9THEO|nr:polysaccharide deacetylase family protein [Aceticella autotrophica]QSZ27856.1 polysaccharide deacetylase family protein [Aceticella autotrophica]
MIIKSVKKQRIIFYAFLIVFLSILVGSGVFYYNNTLKKPKNLTKNVLPTASSVIEKNSNKDDNNTNFDKKSEPTTSTPVDKTNISQNNDTHVSENIANSGIDNHISNLVNKSNRDQIFNDLIPFEKPFSVNSKAGKIIALTFDDGPSNEFTKKYVDLLKSMNINGTFFVIGKNAEKHPELLKYIYENGNEIGLHSYSHPFLPKLTPEQMVDELYKTQEIVYNATGEKPILFRPPYGAYNKTLLQISNALGLHIVLWNVDPDDWKKPGIESIVNRVILKVKPGSVILLHEGKPETFAALPQIIQKLKAEGYSFATVSNLMKIDEVSTNQQNEKNAGK